MRFTVLLLSLITACATGAAPASSGSAPRNPDVITQQELTDAPYSNAYDAIQRLRPQMLMQRAGTGSSSITQQAGYAIRVYLDNIPAGGVADLKQIALAGIRDIRYLGPTDATQRFGTGNAGGAILIRTH
jgi:TonB-dependent Receptor Plug Domain